MGSAGRTRMSGRRDSPGPDLPSGSPGTGEARNQTLQLKESSKAGKTQANPAVQGWSGALAPLPKYYRAYGTLQMLSLQQQMVENLVIAKAREETLQQKMEEQWLQLQEAANRRFSSSMALTPEDQEQRSLYTAILKYEQDHLSTCRRLLWGQRAVLWVQDVCWPRVLWGKSSDWLRQCKSRLKQSPADLSLLSGLFSCLLSFMEHSIAQLLQQLQRAVYTRLYPAITWGAADTTVASPTVLSFLLLGPGALAAGSEPPKASNMFLVPEHDAVGPQHNLSSMPLAAVPSTPVVEGGWPEPAATPQTPWESSFEDLEQFLASPEGWAPREPLAGLKTEMMLLEHLRGIVWDIHNAIDRLLSLMLLAFKRLNTATSKDQCPACLEEAFFPPLWALLLALYSSAIEDLRLIPLETYPCRKLECIAYSVGCLGDPQHLLCAAVRPLCSIYKCAKEYCGAWDRQISTSAAMVLLLPELMVPISSSRADNLLPILSYVVLQTGLPQLLAECAALEELIYEGYLTGEKGYCLTSLQSTLSYMESLQ
ncbi:LOW QUALITY PROTEIN: VPS9 domain-containing protein 1-like [Amazona ochrocephala]